MSTNANSLNAASNGILGFTGTAFVENSVTQYGILIGGSTSSSVTSITSSTAGQLFLGGGGSSNPSYVTPTAGTNVALTSNASTLGFGLSGGYALIQSQNATSSSTISFTTGITTTYNTYYLFMVNAVVSAASATALTMNLSSNGGMSYISTGYQSSINTLQYNSTTFSNSNITTGLAISSYSNTYVQNALIQITNLTNGKYPYIYGQGCYANTTSTTCFYQMNWGAYLTGTVMNALQISPASGNITSGTFVLYGLIE